MAALGPLVACGTTPLGRQCGDLPRSYPPATINVAGAEEVEVPWTSWSCPGYDADTLDEPAPAIDLGPDRSIGLSTPIEDGAELEVRVSVAGEWVYLEVEAEAPLQEITIPPGGTSLFVRMCTDDGRCANYQADLMP